MAYVFGPVPSRRLGLSLGVDLIPHKTCTYDCLYCQVGKTTNLVSTPEDFVPVNEVISELEKKLLTCFPDVITLAGSGEPTLYSKIGQVIGSIKKITKKKVVVLTNGSLCRHNEIRRRILGADIIMPTFTSIYEKTFRQIHRPHPGFDPAGIINGLEKLRLDFSGEIFLEVVFLAGINDTDKEVEGLKTAIERISPDKIQLNTVIRPPADSRAISLDIKRLEEIMVFFGEKAELVSVPRITDKITEKKSPANRLLEMVKRRPLKSDDISNALGLSSDEVENLVKGLLIKGQIRKQEHSGEVYFISNVHSEM